MAGCDSTLTIDLTINNQTSGNIIAETCDTYELNDSLYTESGVYTQILTNVNGCDSILTLNLTVIDVDASVSNEGFTIIASQDGATYQWVNCDTNLPIDGETNQSFTATANGNYSVSVTIGDCIENSECVNITGVGIRDISNVLNIYPNPSRGQFTLEMSSRKTVPYQVFNALGQLMQDGIVTDVKTDIDLSREANGIYFLRVEYDTFRLIKN